MKICPLIQVADAKEMRRQGERAFTMIEIAIAIGVIGFALVAIIGVLPTGMNVQKDNREDTLVSQDAPYFLDAIRNGAVVVNGSLSLTNPAAQGLDFLTNYVQSIRFDYIQNGVINSNISISYPLPNTPYWLSGAEILGLLTTPQTNYASPYFSNNYFDVTATMRALSGPATLQQQSGLNNAMAFTYKMEVMVSPFNSYAPDTTNYTAYLNSTDPNQWIIRSNRWLAATPGLNNLLPYSPYLTPSSGALSYNLFEVRLRFSWPVLQNGNVGPGRQTYRTLVSAPMAQASAGRITGWFFQPLSFTNVYPNGL